MKNAGSRVLLVFFGLFWSGITLTCAGFAAHASWQQLRTCWFHTTQGVITHSAMVRTRGGKGGRNYNVDIRYDYVAAGRKFSGTRYFFGAISTGGAGARRWVDEAMRDFPAGAHVPVHYDPAQPATAVLVRGLQGVHYFMALFLTPFVGVMLGVWWTGFAALRRGGEAWPRPRIFERPDGATAVRLVEVPPAAWALAVGCLAAFVSVFVVGFAFGGFAPYRTAAQIAWGIVLVLGAWAFAWQRRRIGRGDFDLVVDGAAHTVSLPLHDGRKERLIFPLNEIEFVDVERRTERTRKGGTSETWWPRLVCRNGTAHRLVQRGESEAQTLAALLGARFGWTVRPDRQTA